MAFTTSLSEVWAEAANHAFRGVNVGLGLVNNRWRGELNAFGDVVTLSEPGAVTTNAYAGYANLTFEQPSDSVTTITVDQADYTAIDVDDVDAVQASESALGAHAEEAVFSLNSSADSFVFGSYVNAGSGIRSDHDNPVDITAQNIYGILVSAGESLSGANVPHRGRWVAFSAADAAKVRSAPEFSLAIPVTANRPRGTGEVGNLAGFSVVSTNNLTTLSGVRKTLVGHDRAIGFAGPRITASERERELRFASAIRYLSIYGKTVVRTSALSVIHTRG